MGRVYVAETCFSINTIGFAFRDRLFLFSLWQGRPWAFCFVGIRRSVVSELWH